MAYVKIDHGKTTSWMPIQEYDALMELRSKMSLEEQQRFAYYMWNNFSYDGYEEWLKSKNNVQDKSKEEE